LLIVDDELSIRRSLYNTFKKTYQVETASCGLEAVKKVESDDFDLVLLDQKMPDLDGLQVLREIRKIDDRVIIIMITAYGSIESSVEAMKLGAYDYILKPYELDEIKMVVEKAINYQNLAEEVVSLKVALSERFQFSNIMAKSKKMQDIFQCIQDTADTDVSILILGESGTGKELIAKAIHYNSLRRSKPMVIVNCAALPEELLENEIFGHEKGAFTGADRRRIGKAEEANEGTLFLDEIGDLSIKTQPKLLRFLQDGKIERLGSNKSIQLDVRVIAATNQDIESALEEGTFRKDLYYRLNTLTIDIPPLRERKEDISLLADHFLSMYSKVHKKKVSSISLKVIEQLINYSWPGNVRELEKVIERGVVLAKGSMIHTEQISEEIRKVESASEHQDFMRHTLSESVEILETKMIKDILDKSSGNRKKAAKMLGISLRSLQYKIKKYFS
ncbi:MAG: sigma-54-dependent Fis family transcriptional regulator, partial [Deltaproteobacteria bacterium]|nr:sigma-54-dependent Fis family transcriptional regulator [Deltaproteobacteria bacterium]